MTVTTANLPGLTPGTWNIDANHSSVGFSARHLMVSKVRGTFRKYSGAITVNEDGTGSVHAEIELDSFDTGNEQRDNHVRSADYLDTATYPLMTFDSTDIRANGETFIVTGDLSLRGVTKSVDLVMEYNGTNPGMGRGEVAGFEATTVLNRKDFSVNLDMPLADGGVVLGDKITVVLEIEALKAS